ncbi:hypothetical protein ABK01_08375 [Treponema sp. OMZ 305]|nr:hypothetical protein ABK01_08375 [Treponema sp. OMZ 305]
MTASFAGSRNIAFDKTSGIRAAAQRIISAMDGGAYMQGAIEFVTTNSMFKNIHGRIFLNAPVLYFQLTPCSYTIYFQKHWF